MILFIFGNFKISTNCILLGFQLEDAVANGSSQFYLSLTMKEKKQIFFTCINDML